MTERFIGRGWRYPLGTDPTGGIAMATGDDELEQAIRLILTTAPGERPMRPEFGCGVHRYVFEPADAATAGRLAYEVKRSLTRWEPRITVDRVEVSADRATPYLLYIDIRYSRKGSYDPRNLVFPFYVIPEED